MQPNANSGKREGRQRWPKQRQRKADNNQPKSGSNSSRNGAGGGGEGGSRGSGSGSGNGNGCNGGDNAAAMAAVTAAPTWRRQWQRGRPMWAEVIFHSTYYYLHDSTYICDNNCQAYGKTQKCFDSKHKCVLIGKTHLCFAKHICVFNLWACLLNTLSEGH